MGGDRDDARRQTDWRRAQVSQKRDTVNRAASAQFVTDCAANMHASAFTDINSPSFKRDRYDRRDNPCLSDAHA